MTDTKHELEQKASRHTPGPWSTPPKGPHESYTYFVWSAGGFCVAEVPRHEDACRIAAVPELLLALADIVRLADHAFGTSADYTARCGNIARAAIAEAGGRAV